jgi:hypothetical protein
MPLSLITCLALFRNDEFSQMNKTAGDAIHVDGKSRSGLVIIPEGLEAIYYQEVKRVSIACQGYRVVYGGVDCVRRLTQY